MSPINTIFRALLLTFIVFLLLFVFKNKTKQDLKQIFFTTIPKDTLKNAPNFVIDWAVKNIPMEKQTRIANISAEISSASANMEPYKQEKIKELKLMLIDELYKTAIENIKK